MPTLDRITIYPVKSLDGVDVAEARILPSGALENDRRWQLVDLEGRVVNAKRTPLFHAIRAEFDLGGAGQEGGEGPVANLIHLAVDAAALRAGAIPGVSRLAALGVESFPLVPGPDGPCRWLSAALGIGVLLLERVDGGFPDDRDAPGPTVISTGTLAEVGRWFSFDLAEARRRFRANLEVGGCEAFREDALASPARPALQPSLLDLSPDEPADPYADLPPPEPREFAIGAARFRAANVCRRCVVPSRDSRTGAVTEHFRDVFEARRARGLPMDVDASHWGSLYWLGVNTARVGLGDIVRVGASLHPDG